MQAALSICQKKYVLWVPLAILLFETVNIMTLFFKKTFIIPYPRQKLVFFQT